MVQHASGGRGEHEPLSVEELRRIAEHLEHAGRERHPVLSARLHALGQNRPHRPVPVELLPPGVAHLAGARGGEHLELEGQHSAAIGTGVLHARERRPDLGAGQE